jgi:hypothetical protein
LLIWRALRVSCREYNQEYSKLLLYSSLYSYNFNSLQITAVLH